MAMTGRLHAPPTLLAATNCSGCRKFQKNYKSDKKYEILRSYITYFISFIGSIYWLYFS